MYKMLDQYASSRDLKQFTVSAVTTHSGKSFLGKSPITLRGLLFCYILGRFLTKMGSFVLSYYFWEISHQIVLYFRRSRIKLDDFVLVSYILGRSPTQLGDFMLLYFMMISHQIRKLGTSVWWVEIDRVILHQATHHQSPLTNHQTVTTVLQANLIYGGDHVVGVVLFDMCT